MAVLQIATGARCKLCQHPRRNDIDQLLEQRSRRRQDADGKNINLDYVKAKLAEWGVENPTTENVSNHVKKHLEFVDDQAQEAAMAAVQQALAEKPARSGKSVEEDMRWVIDVVMAEAEERIARGEKSGFTVDHAMKAAAELSRRSHNEAQREVLGALAGGIGMALAVAVEKKQLPEGDVFDAEDADFEEVGA